METTESHSQQLKRLKQILSKAAEVEFTSPDSTALEDITYIWTSSLSLWDARAIRSLCSQLRRLGISCNSPITQATIDLMLWGRFQGSKLSRNWRLE